MKRIFFLSSLFASLLASAQQMPDSIAGKTATLSFKGKYHALIYELMPDRGSADAINYVNQLRSQVAGSTFDTAQLFTVATPYRMVWATVNNLGIQQERLTASDNAELKDCLLKQLSVPAYLDLLQVLGYYFKKSSDDTEAIRAEGIKKIMAVNP